MERMLTEPAIAYLSTNQHGDFNPHERFRELSYVYY